MGVAECFGKDYSDLGTNYIKYTVKKGDNLYDIAKSFAVSVNQIKQLNNLTSNQLSIGQVLKIKEVN